QFRKALAVDCGEDAVAAQVLGFGIYQLKDINAMGRWQSVPKNVSNTEEKISWAVNSANKRIAVPVDLFDG
ncbi:hypothetical protein F442_22294, partial [Phytophthora nicotianae P10297]